MATLAVLSLILKLTLLLGADDVAVLSSIGGGLESPDCDDIISVANDWPSTRRTYMENLRSIKICRRGMHH
jgi:hypothetical protein